MLEDKVVVDREKRLEVDVTMATEETHEDVCSRMEVLPQGYRMWW